VAARARLGTRRGAALTGRAARAGWARGREQREQAGDGQPPPRPSLARAWQGQARDGARGLVPAVGRRVLRGHRGVCDAPAALLLPEHLRQLLFRGRVPVLNVGGQPQDHLAALRVLAGHGEHHTSGRARCKFKTSQNTLE
jgi:hypothetical protein